MSLKKKWPKVVGNIVSCFCATYSEEMKSLFNVTLKDVYDTNDTNARLQYYSKCRSRSSFSV